MGIIRTTLLGGPATASWKGHTFVAQAGILVTPALELAAVDSDAQGVLDATVTAEPMRIQFSPSAPFAEVRALLPFLEGVPGTSLFGSADVPLVLTAANGVRLTFAAVALTQMPNLALTSRGVVAESVTFLARGARGGPVAAVNRLVTIETVTPPVMPGAQAQLSDDFVVTWGGAPWANLRSRDGVALTFGMKTRAVESAANALLDLSLESLTATARFTPASDGGPGENDLVTALQAQGAGALPGRLLSQGARELTIAGEHLYVRMPLAQLTGGSLRFDAKHLRVGELEFTATRVLLGAEPRLDGLVGLSEGAPY